MIRLKRLNKKFDTKCLQQTGQNGAIKSRYGVEEKNKKDSNKQQLLTKVDFKIQRSWNRTVVMTIVTYFDNNETNEWMHM